MIDFLKQSEFRSASIHAWMNDGAAQPLTLWPDEPANYIGTEILLPKTVSFDAGYRFMPSRLKPVNLYNFRNVKLSSNGGKIFREGQKFKDNNIQGSYSDLTTSDENILRQFHEKTSDDIKAAFMFLHNPFDTYGHFLLEMVPKLIAYRYLLAEIPTLPVLLSWYTPNHVVQWLNLIVPNAPKVYLERDKNTTVNEAFYCDMFSHHSAIGTAFFEYIDYAKSVALPDTFPLVQEKLFLSRASRRSKRGDFRIWKNEKDIEEALVSEGFIAVAPETLSIQKQINMFHRAKVVVGELSSALHNVIFSNPGTRIIQVNPFSATQRRLSLPLGHKLTSLVPDSGELAGWPPKEGKREFSIGKDRILAAINSND